MLSGGTWGWVGCQEVELCVAGVSGRVEVECPFSVSLAIRRLHPSTALPASGPLTLNAAPPASGASPALPPCPLPAQSTACRAKGIACCPSNLSPPLMHRSARLLHILGLAVPASQLAGSLVWQAVDQTDLRPSGRRFAWAASPAVHLMLAHRWRLYCLWLSPLVHQGVRGLHAHVSMSAYATAAAVSAGEASDRQVNEGNIVVLSRAPKVLDLTSSHEASVDLTLLPLSCGVQHLPTLLLQDESRRLTFDSVSLTVLVHAPG